MKEWLNLYWPAFYSAENTIHHGIEEPPTGKCGFADGLITLSSAGFFRMSNAIRHRVAMERIFSAGVSPETAREAAMIVNSAWIQAFSSIHWEYMCLKELPPEGGSSEVVWETAGIKETITSLLKKVKFSLRPTCPYCGARIQRGSKFCPKCGAKLED